MTYDSSIVSCCAFIYITQALKSKWQVVKSRLHAFFYLFTGIYYLWLCIKQSAYFRMHSYQTEELKLVLPLVQLNPKAVRVALLWFPLRKISFISSIKCSGQIFFHRINTIETQFMMAFTDWLISFYAVTPTVLLQWTFNSSACRLYFVTTTWLDDLHTVILGFERNYIMRQNKK